MEFIRFCNCNDRVILIENKILIDRYTFNSFYSILNKYSIVSSVTDLLDQNSPDKNLSLDLKSLRAVRVIRPLKLVNGVPSKFQIK